MTVEEVQRVMAPHLQLGAFTPTPEEIGCLPDTPDSSEALIFIHCPRGYTDHCEVRLDAMGVVCGIKIVKD